MPMNDHSQEPERTTTRKVYCMYEGLVEKQYFDHFNGKCDINFSEIPRSGLDSDKFNENIAEYEDSFASADVYKTDGWNYTSKRWDMIQIADNYISCIQNEKYTTFGFISEVLSEIWLNMKRENRKPYVKFLFKFYSLLNSGNISIEQFMKTETIKTAADYFS